MGLSTVLQSWKIKNIKNINLNKISYETNNNCNVMSSFEIKKNNYKLGQDSKKVETHFYFLLRHTVLSETIESGYIG